MFCHLDGTRVITQSTHRQVLLQHGNETRAKPVLRKLYCCCYGDGAIRFCVKLNPDLAVLLMGKAESLETYADQRLQFPENEEETGDYESQTELTVDESFLISLI